MTNLEIIQPGSFGDILFIQKLCKILSKEYDVYHKISPQMWNSGIDQLETVINCGPNINIPNDGLQYDCSAQAEGRPPSDVMTCKYEGAGVSYDDWSNYLIYNRYFDRENKLKEILNIKDNEPFIIVNEYYSFNKVHKGVKNCLPPDYDGKIIYMNPTTTDKIFDWCWVFENAEEIHSVDTSIHYIIETLDIKANRLVTHPRHFYHSPLVYEKILNKSWEWIKNTEDEWKKFTQ